MPRVTGNPVVQRRHLDASPFKHLQKVVAVVMQQTRDIHSAVIALARLDQLVDFKALGRVPLAVIDQSREVHVRIRSDIYIDSEVT